MRRWFVLLILISVLVLAGCQRTASEAPTDVQNQDTETGNGGELPFPSPDANAGEETSPDEMATELAGGGFATQTALAAEAGGGQPPAEPTPTPEPQAAEPTDPPADDEAPPAEPQPEPTDEPEPAPQPAACSSPYKVSDGEWVWSIGRKCNIHPDSIIEVNGLRWPYTLYPGDELVLPDNAPPFPTGG